MFWSKISLETSLFYLQKNGSESTTSVNVSNYHVATSEARNMAIGTDAKLVQIFCQCVPQPTSEQSHGKHDIHSKDLVESNAREFCLLDWFNEINYSLTSSFVLSISCAKNV